MVVGTCTYDIYISNSHSLKDKRRVLKSMIERVKNKFNVSIAEVGLQDNWQRAVVGLATVSNNTTRVNQVLNNITNFIEDFHDEIELIDIKIEIN